jgi:hypothetical protein
MSFGWNSNAKRPFDFRELVYLSRIIVKELEAWSEFVQEPSSECLLTSVGRTATLSSRL